MTTTEIAPRRSPSTGAIDWFPELICPACRGPLTFDGLSSSSCRSCPRDWPAVAGLPDLRLAPDRYLSLADERTKAEALAEAASTPGADVSRVASAYYALTDDVVDQRRDRFLRHIAGAVARGEALASRLPGAGLMLEIGCGTGGLLVAAARSGRSIVGVDVASRWLVVARRRLADHGLRLPLVAAGGDQLPWPDATFDAVAADSVLEHLDDPASALREWRRVLKPGGELVVWSPNRFTLTTDPHLGLWGVGWLPRAWVPSYLSRRGRTDWPPGVLSAFEARRLARRSGWVGVSVEPPGVTESWARTRSASERGLLFAYNVARRLPMGRGILRAVGPLWELRAEAPRGEVA